MLKCVHGAFLQNKSKILLDVSSLILYDFEEPLPVNPFPVALTKLRKSPGLDRWGPWSRLGIRPGTSSNRSWHPINLGEKKKDRENFL